MAASTLAEIDWDDMDSAEVTTAVQLLAVATQERFNIASVDKDGTLRRAAGTSQLPESYWAFFPYKTNDPIFTFNDGDPLIDFTTQVEDLISGMIDFYADIEKWDDADTNGETNGTMYNLGDAADAPGTYDNRLFEITGYTSYPDLSVYAPEEVKKWYDMIVECQYIIRKSGEDNDDYLIFNGLFDVEADAALVVNQDGAEYFGGDPTAFAGEPKTDNTVYAAFKAGNDALFGTVPTNYDESVDSGTFPPQEPRLAPVYDFRVAIGNSGVNKDKYFSWNRSWQITYVADWTDSITAIGLTGRPLSYKNQCKAGHSITTSPSFSPVYTYPASTTADNERYYTTNVVTQNGNKDEIAVDHLLSPMTSPANITTLSSGHAIQGHIQLVSTGTPSGFGADQFLEFWDGDGGFDSYTPP